VIAHSTENARDRAPEGSGYLDHRLVGFDGNQRISWFDPVAHFNVPGDDLSFLQTLS
jgi:hypothetical protein